MMAIGAKSQETAMALLLDWKMIAGSEGEQISALTSCAFEMMKLVEGLMDASGAWFAA